MSLAEGWQVWDDYSPLGCFWWSVLPSKNREIWLPARVCSSWRQNRKVLDSVGDAALDKRPPRAPAAPRFRTDPPFPSKTPRHGDPGQNWDEARGANDGLLFSPLLLRKTPLWKMRRPMVIVAALYARSSCYF